MDHDESLLVTYFQWLFARTHLSNAMYGKLYQMFNYEFVAYVDHDDVRIEDALKLREDFACELGYSQDVIDYILDSHPVSVLEVLLALSDRIDHELTMNREGYIYFVDILDNMGILEANEDEVLAICHEFVERLYPYCGMAFRLNSPKRDQRDVDLWYQMQAYLIENDL